MNTHPNPALQELFDLFSDEDLIRLLKRRLLCRTKNSMISYLLSNGRSGDISDPAALRQFYTRIFHGHKSARSKRASTFATEPRRAPVSVRFARVETQTQTT